MRERRFARWAMRAVVVAVLGIVAAALLIPVAYASDGAVWGAPSLGVGTVSVDDSSSDAPSAQLLGAVWA